MINALKSEFRKLLTVRSTYAIVLITLVLLGLIAGYINGYRMDAAMATNPFKVMSDAQNAVTIMAMLGVIVGILLVTHEYRYNTVMYTLTAANSRTKVWLAKLIAISVFAVVFTAITAVASPLFAYIGVHLAGHEVATQTIYYGDLLWRIFFYGWGYAMIGFILASIIRNQIGALAAFFLLQNMIEGILGLLLKENAKYLPGASLNSVIAAGPNYSSTTAAKVVMIYLMAGWLISWLLFLRRDAN